MSFRDPIVEEVWRLRAEAWEACEDDPTRYFSHLAELAASHPERMIGPEQFLRRYGTAEDRFPLPPQPAEEDARRAS